MSYYQLTDTDFERIRMSVSEGRKSDTYSVILPQDLEDLATYALAMKNDAENLRYSYDKYMKENSSKTLSVLEKNKELSRRIDRFIAETENLNDKNMRLTDENKELLQQIRQSPLETYYAGSDYVISSLCSAFALSAKDFTNKKTYQNDAVAALINAIRTSAGKYAQEYTTFGLPEKKGDE